MGLERITPKHIFQCMLERTDAITEKILEPITFVLEYPTAISKAFLYSLLMYLMLRSRMLCRGQFSREGARESYEKRTRAFRSYRPSDRPISWPGSPVRYLRWHRPMQRTKTVCSWLLPLQPYQYQANAITDLNTVRFDPCYGISNADLATIIAYREYP